jgi:UDP-3-O-[3-hydroxymyristoyl] glucosamine N-acyltransferase
MEDDKMKLSELARKFNLKIIRDGAFGSLGILSNQKKKMLVFIENAKYIPALDKKYVSCVICTPEISEHIEREFALATTDSPRKSFFNIHNNLLESGFYPKLNETNISPTAKIDRTAYIAKENIHIGNNCVIEPNVTIFPNTWIGDNVVIRAGSIIGSEGFQFARIKKEIIPIHHAGGVWISDNVEIQSHCCVDKSVFGEYTSIGEDTKLDNLVHISHNVIIGKRCLIAACAMIAGSAKLGNDIWVGPAAIISSEVKIGNKASITIGAVVTKDVAPGQRVSGHFAIEHKRFIEFMKTIR